MLSEKGLINLIEKLKNKLNSSSIISNIIILLKGNVLSSAIGLINTIILVKAIGLENNGVFFMAQSYAMLFNTLFNFQSYNAIIMFIPKVVNNKCYKIENYLKQGFYLDFITAIIAIIIAFLMINPVSGFMKWDNNIRLYMYITCFIIIFRTTGTMLGILRVFNNFKYIALTSIIESFFRLTFFFIGYFYSYGLLYFLIIEVISSAVSMLSYIIFTIIVLKKEKLCLKKVKTKWDKDFFKFNCYSNLESSLDLPIAQLTPFIINYLLGFSDIAIYKIVEKIGSIISKVTIPISQAIVPDISKLLASNDKDSAMNIHKNTKKIILILGIILIAFCIITSNLWIELFIPNTIYNKSVLVLYLIYLIYTNMNMAIHPVFTFMGYIKKNIPIICFSNFIYLILLIILAFKIGVIGVILARLIQSIIVIKLKNFVLKKNNYQFVRI